MANLMAQAVASEVLSTSDHALSVEQETSLERHNRQDFLYQVHGSIDLEELGQ